MNHKRTFAAGLLSTTALVAALPVAAQTLPTGYGSAYGSVGFERSSGTLTINQSSQNAIVNYNSFSIGARNTVNINQPTSSSAILNRVTGNTPSTIAGRLNANGQVYLINPNGIAITKTGLVKVGGGFVASTLGMSDDEFKHSRKHFKGNGSSAQVSNAGTITIGRGGYAALIGGEVLNSGMISVPMGKVGLGSGEAATLDVSGDGFLQIAVPTMGGGKGALIQQSGTISAAGGTVILDAATARAAARNAVNISGTIDAHSIAGHDGSIVIGGGDGGTVNVSGTLNVSGGRHYASGSVAITGRKIRVSGTIAASGRVGGSVTLAAADGTKITGTIKAIGHHGRGGAVTVTGLHVALKGATVDASGTTGGGTILIGGDEHGAGPLANAKTTTIDATTVITADATGHGNGGNVVVWSDEMTSFAGLISAKGGPRGGNSGAVEVSSHDLLGFTGSVDLLAPGGGSTGTLLLDPYNVTISTGTNNLNATGTNPLTYTPTATSTINSSTLSTELANASVIITTGTTGSTTSGTIGVAGALSWNSTNSLTLTANQGISTSTSGTITATNGSLILNPGASSVVSFGAAVNVANLTVNATSTVTQSAKITATNLLLLGSGTTDTLTTTTNSIGTLAANVGAGTVSVYDIANLTIGTAGTTNGVTAGTLNLSFSSGKGVATESQPITVNSLSLAASGSGTNTLTNASNSIATFAASVGTSGTINLGDNSGTLSIGTVNSINGVIAGTLTLTNSGAVTQSQKLSVTNLALLGSSGSYMLTNTSNSVGTLAANTGTVNLVDNTALKIGTAGGITGATLSGTLTLNAKGTISDPTAGVSVNAFILAGGTWSQVGTLPSFTATTDFELNGNSFLRATGGSGTTSSPYQIADVYGLQGIGTMLGGNFALANTINAGGTSGWNGGAGFVPIGNSTNYFNGSFNGNGFTISGLSINQPSSGNPVGLFGAVYYTGPGTAIQNLTLTGLNVTGNEQVGGLVGNLLNGNVSSVSASGSVNGTSEVGGLVGDAGYAEPNSPYTANFSNSSSSVAATGSSSGGSVGGLIGYLESGDVSNSFATGTITGGGGIGGLIGSGGYGTVYQSYATGTVTSNSEPSGGNAGGLVGYSSLSISQSFATGAVFGYNDASLGGLAGSNFGAITDSYATGAVTQTNFNGGNPNGGASIGGLVGFEENGSITHSYATGMVSGSNPGSVNVGGPGIDIGGLVGAVFIDAASTIYQSTFDRQTTGRSNGIGYSTQGFNVAGETTAQLQAALPNGFNTTVNGACASCWGIVPNQTYPLLLWQPGVISGEVFTTYGGSPVGAGITVSDLINGAAGSTTSTAANGGYFFYLGTNGITAGSQVVVYTSSGVSYAQNVSGGVTGLNIYGTYLSETTPTTTASGLASGLTAAINGSTNTALQTEASGLPNLSINATGTGFAIDQALNVGGGTLVLSSSGAVTQSAALTAGNVALLGTGTNYTLTNVSNAIGTLAASAGAINVTDSTPLTINSVAGTNNLASTGTVTLTADAITLTPSTGAISAPGETVTIAPFSSATTLGLGTGTGTLALTQQELNAITAATLTFGGTGTAGPITVGGTVAVPSTITNLTLASGGALNVSTGASITDGNATGALILQGNAVTIAGAITAPGLTVSATGSITDTASVNVGTFDLNGGNWSQNLASLPTFSANTFAITSGTFLRVAGGNGTTSPYQLTDVYGLQGVAGFLNSSFQLANSIDASSTAGWNGGAGFVPIGSSSAFSGTLNGQGFTVSNLTINQPSGNSIGLVANLGGTIENLGLAGANITGANYVGGLVGVTSSTASISNSYVTGAVAGGATDGNGNDIGGLVGTNTGSIALSYATATVSGNSEVGGLVGYSSTSTGTSISQSYATGAVTGLTTPSFYPQYIGGLIGHDNAGTVSQVYATGAVTAINATGVGGLIGLFGTTSNGSSAKLTDAYATGAVNFSGVEPDGGGLIGWIQGGSNSSSTTTVTNTYATGVVTGSQSPGGLIGVASGTKITVSDSYWDITTNPSLQGVGSGQIGTMVVTADTTAQLQGNSLPSPYLPTGFSTTVWGIVQNQTFPYLLFSPTVSISGTDYTTYGGTAVSGATVSDLVNGVAGSSTAATNGSGAYTLYLAPGTIAPDSQLLVYTSSGASYDQNVSASVSGLNIYGTYLSQSTSGGTLSSLASGRATAIGANTAVSTAANGLANQLITANGTSFAIDQAVNTGTLVFSTTGAVTQSAAITATTGLGLLGNGATYMLTNTSNSVGTLAANTGSVNLADSTGLSIGSVAGTTGVTAMMLTLADSGSGSAIAQTQAIIVSGSSSFTATASNATIALSQANFLSGAASLSTAGTGGNASLTNNQATNLGASVVGGNLAVTSGGGLSITGAVTSGTASLAATGNLMIAASGGVTAAANGSVVLSATGKFTNLAGSNAVSVSGTGRWLIYSSAPANDTFGGLDSNNTAIWDAAGLTLPPSSVTATGNRYVFASQPTLTFTSTSVTKTYGADNSAAVASAYTVSGLQSGITNAFLGDTAASVYSGTPAATSNGAVTTAGVAGAPYAINVAQGSLTALSGYAFAFSSPGQLTVNPAALTITANAQSKPYGINDPALSYVATGLVNGDTLTGALSRAGYGTAAGENVGTYAINQGSLTAGSNYTLAVTSGANLTITPATLTIAANAQSKAYGTTDPALTYVATGLVDGTADGLVIDDTTSLTGTLARPISRAGEQVGSYAIGQGSLTATNNYNLAYAGANLTITPATLTIAANAQSKTYGTNDPALTYVATGLVDGTADGIVLDDTMSLTGTLARPISRASEQVGSYAIGQGSLTATNNYNLAYAGANLTITPATLTIAANAQSKAYGTNDPTLTYVATGLVDGTADGIAIDDTTSLTGTLARPISLAREQVGSYAIGQGSLAATNNYSLAYAGANLTITPATLTIAANAQSKTYGTNDPALTYVATGLVDGTADGLVIDDTTSLTGTLARPISRAGEQVGSYAIGQGSLTATNNYNLAYAGANLTITPATLTIAANAQSKTYGTNDPALTYVATGLVDGTADGLVIDDTTSLTGTLARPISRAREQVGSYAIGQGSLTASNNYSLAYAGANLTITPATLTIAANAQSKPYGTNDPALTYVATGLVDGTADGIVLDDTMSLTGTLARPISRAGEQVGSYAIGQGSLTATNNYNLAYAGANLTITPATLTIAANAQSKTYGTNDPVLTYVATGLVDATADGLVIDDTTSLTGTLARPISLASEQVGSYAIGQGTLAASNNYNLAYAGANLTITPATLTIAANAQSKAYGTNDPALTYVATGLVDGTADGLVIDDTTSLTGTLARPISLAREQVGSYAIGQGSLTASNNYSLAYAGANLTITPATLTIAANAQSKPYGTTDPALTYVATGLVDGTADGIAIDDTTSLTGTLARPISLASEQVGSYAIGQGSLAATNNYSLAYAGANLTITPAALTIAANAQSKTYGTNDPVLTYVATGLVDATADGLVIDDTTSLTGTLARPISLASEQVGSYAIGQGTLAASNNYSLAYAGANLTITPAALTIAANAQSKTYGTNDPALTYVATGLVDGTADGIAIDDTTSLTGTLARPISLASEQVGSYAIGQGTLAASNNYSLAYAGANLTITPAALTIAANAQSKTYGTNDPALTYVATGLVDATADGIAIDDTLTGAMLTSAGSGPIAPVMGSPYAIHVSNAQGSGLSNYTINYAAGALTVTPATVVVTANGGTSIYGNVPANPGLSATGLQNGESISVMTGLSNSLGINGRTSVGAYAVTVMGTLTNANYVVSATKVGTFDVTPRPLTITADNETRAQGFANPPLAYQIGGLGLVNGDGLSGALLTPATIASPVGRYAIDQGTLAANSNYVVTYVRGTMSVDASADQSATTLGSTADRALLQILGRPIDALPFVFPTAEDATSASEIIRDLGDPRFDETIVCVKDICTVAVTRKPIKTTSLEQRP